MDWIKSNDLWGVSLNQGMNRIENKQTFWGGVLSVAIKVIALCFLVVSLTIDSKVPRTQLPVDIVVHPDYYSEVQYEEAQAPVFWVLSKTDEYERPLYLEETEGYLVFEVE